MSARTDTWNMLANLQRCGIATVDAYALRRIAMTLHRWAERECNGEIERDEVTGKTYGVYNINGPGPMRRYRIADREKGAQKRLAAIMARYPQFIAYEQTDPRGAPLYLVSRERLGDKPVDSYYNAFGIAVHA